MKHLLLLTALLEIASGLALAIAPSFSIQLLLGSPLIGNSSWVVTRIAAMALMTLGIASGMLRRESRNPTVLSFVWALLFYNLSVACVLAYPGIAWGQSGILLWPAVLLHSVLAMGCVSVLRGKLAS